MRVHGIVVLLLCSLRLYACRGRMLEYDVLPLTVSLAMQHRIVFSENHLLVKMPYEEGVFAEIFIDDSQAFASILKHCNQYTGFVSYPCSLPKSVELSRRIHIQSHFPRSNQRLLRVSPGNVGLLN